MRILSALPALAFLALATPAWAQDAPAPDAQTGTEAPSTEAPAGEAPAGSEEAAPARSTTPAPEGVSEDVDKVLWCGHAFSEVSEQAKAAGDDATATQMGTAGTALIERGSTSLTEAGITPERLAEIKTAYGAQIDTELQGSGASAKFSFQDCVALAQ